MTPIRTAAAIAALSLALAGCASTSTTAAPAAPAKTPTASATAFNDYDVGFATLLIDHERQGVLICSLAPARKGRTEVANVAAALSKAGTAQVQTLVGWLRTWGRPVPPEGKMDHGGGNAMPGMATADDMDRLVAAQGTDFDTTFLAVMIKHHAGAEAIARREQANGKNPAALALAAKLLAELNKEIGDLKKLQ
jgi:uncharacterized protein (DUF305 family)